MAALLQHRIPILTCAVAALAVAALPRAGTAGTPLTQRVFPLASISPHRVSPDTDRPQEIQAFVDAILADVDGATVAASDIALARALSLFGFRPSEAPIQTGDVERFVDPLLVEREAARLGIQGSAEEVEAAWQAAAARLGGMGLLTAWLLRTGIEEAWARRLVAAELRRERFIHLRFRAFAFVAETDVLAALGPGPHTEAARRRMREALAAEVTDRELSRWLAEARARAHIQHVAAGRGAVPNPFPMPRGTAGP